ncbi:unnamed protein product [Caenorhabditis auriculariae]|uniref:Uncharacterized protein n=1 Tax=Caenorhabditis auriculariae TaxID=2777116 RepID=A0A8S1GV92_9PELO|nr:unnamed protein product [Caenorhabditis auriculariae]
MAAEQKREILAEELVQEEVAPLVLSSFTSVKHKHAEEHIGHVVASRAAVDGSEDCLLSDRRGSGVGRGDADAPPEALPASSLGRRSARCHRDHL